MMFRGRGGGLGMSVMNVREIGVKLGLGSNWLGETAWHIRGGGSRG